MSWTRPLPRGEQTFFFNFGSRGAWGPRGAILWGTLRTQKAVPHLGVDEKRQNWYEMAWEASKINIIPNEIARNFGANPAVTTGMRQDPDFGPN